MIKVLFICHGNICRSPMAEYILKDMVEKRGLSDQFYIASAATSREEIGNPVYPPAKAELAKHGISCKGHHARQVTAEDYENFDYIIGMEKIHIRTMKERMFASLGGDPDGKLYLCMEFSNHPGQEVDDPWYTGRFQEVYQQLSEACQGFLKAVLKR